MLMRMYLKSVDICTHLFASSGSSAAATRSASLIVDVATSEFSSNCGSLLSINPMYAWNLYFHSSKVPYSPVNVGGCILYLCMLIRLCAIVPPACGDPSACAWCAIVAVVVDCLSQAVRVLFCLYVRSGCCPCSPGLSNQDCLLRYHVKINWTCTRCIVMFSTHFCTRAIVSQ